MNTTSHNTYNPRLTVDVNDEDADIADIMSGWCYPDEIRENLEPESQTAQVLPRCYRKTYNTDPLGFLADQFQDSSSEYSEESEESGVENESDYQPDDNDTASSEASEETWNTPSVRSESDKRENAKVPKKEHHEDDTKRVNFDSEEELRLPMRMDPYNLKYYTKEEFNEYYGTNYIWKMMHPKRKYTKDLIWECIEKAKKLNLSDDMVKHILNISLKI